MSRRTKGSIDGHNNIRYPRSPMRSRPIWWILAVALVGLAGCKDPETAAQQARIETSEEKLAEIVTRDSMIGTGLAQVPA